ncbi:NAD(P)H-dependent oxidoreductase subunit E [Sedimenticola sp.]|uniref:NAD(P)H-dependent oxidoreductase subunit E n=1 Tax=Sedimenticola sp. TaxID=1940285 RepID=UPI003D107473
MGKQQQGRRHGGRRGRSVKPEANEQVAELLRGERPARDRLIEYLHRIQDRYGALSADHLVALADLMRLSPVEVYEVATFYHHFDVLKEGETPPPPLTVRVCDSVSCELAGARGLIDALKEGLDSARMRIQKVPCVGRCQEAPVAVVGTRPIAQATPERVLEAVSQGDVSDTAPSQAIDYSRYVREQGYSLLKACVAGERDRESVMQVMADSGLRGLGGAGFPAGRKWRIVSGFPGKRLLAVNIDEGEPGTFKDRHYLERDPHRFLEGMLIAAWAVGCEEIYIYLRDEYAGCRQLLERELQRLRTEPPIALPAIHLRRGAGAYICGEESAMIESLEGKRGMPRQRPPYLAEVGLFGRPTLEHNFETLYWVRDILERGADWFAGHGVNGRKGLRSFSVSGRVNRPGVHLAPAGITLRQLVDEYCGGMLPGHRLKAYFPGGASGGILPAALADLPLDFDTLQAHGCFIGSAAIIVLSDQDSVRNAALNAMRFFAHESCGQCTPCRVGTRKAVDLMEAKQWDQDLLHELAQVMEDASICGLGQAAPNPLRSVLRYFPEEIA